MSSEFNPGMTGLRMTVGYGGFTVRQDGMIELLDASMRPVMTLRREDLQTMLAALETDPARTLPLFAEPLGIRQLAFAEFE